MSRTTLISILASAVVAIIAATYFAGTDQPDPAVASPSIRGDVPLVPALETVPQTRQIDDKLILPKLIVLDDSKELFSDAFAEATPEFVEWADNFYNNQTAPVQAKRYRFVSINYELLHKELEMLPAYVAVVGGQTPPPVYADSMPTFTLTLFNDRRIGLLVTDVRLSGNTGEQYIIMRGEVRGGGKGTFKLSLTKGGQNLHGVINTPRYLTRVDTLRTSDVTAIAEIDRNDIESSDVTID